MTEHHYVYMISYTDVENVYYGSRTSRCLPEEDTKYWGSPVTFKEFMDAHASTRIKTILVADFENRADAIAYESNLIRCQWEKDKPLSLNGSISNEKFNMLGADFTPAHRQKLSDAKKGKPGNRKGKISDGSKGEKLSAETRQRMSDAKKKQKRKPGSWLKGLKGRAPTNAKFYIGISPTGDRIEFENAAKFCRDNPEWVFDRATIIKCCQGEFKQHKGWKFSYADESDIA